MRGYSGSPPDDPTHNGAPTSIPGSSYTDPENIVVKNPDTQEEINSYLLGKEVAGITQQQQRTVIPLQVYHGLVNGLNGKTLLLSNAEQANGYQSLLEYSDQPDNSGKAKSLLESENQRLNEELQTLRKQLQSQSAELSDGQARLALAEESYTQANEKIARLEKTVEELNDQLSYQSYPAVASDGLNAENLPNLPTATSDTSETLPIQEDTLAQTARSIGQRLDPEGELDTEQTENLNDVVSGEIANAGIAFGEGYAESLLSKYGEARIDIGLDADWSINEYALDYLLPVYDDKNEQIFTQLGYRHWGERDMANLGLGYRYFGNKVMWGINAFYDEDITLGHSRGSVGLELGIDSAKLYGNYYTPLSDWKDVDAPGYQLQSRAAAGWDVGINAFIAEAPAWSTTLELFQWQGNHVDEQGNFEEDVSGSAFQELGTDPMGASLSVEYRPFSLFSLGVTKTIGDTEFSDTRLEATFNWNIGQPLGEQLKATTTSLANDWQKGTFVERQNNIVLEYSEKQISENGQTINLSLNEQYSVTERESVTIQADITTAFPVESLQWTGKGAQYLSSTSSQTVVFTAPDWQAAPLSNTYDLTLTVANSNGDSAQVDTQVVVTQNAALKPVLTLYSDPALTKPVSSYSAAHGEQAPTIYWAVEDRGGNEAAVATYQNTDEVARFRWGGDQEILQSIDTKTPVIDVSEPVGSYETKLQVILETGEKLIKSVPIQIAKGAGNRLDAGPDVTLVYVDDPSQVVKSQTTGGDSGTLLYQSSDSNVADVNQSGLVDVHNIGTTHIRVLEKTTDNFERDADSYLLTVLPGDPSLAWDDDQSLIKNGQVSLPQGVSSFTIPAISQVGAEGTITYRVIGDQQVAAVNKNGTVSLKGNQGAVKVEAEITKDGNYRSQVIGYTLIVSSGTTKPHFEWAAPVQNGQYTVTYNDMGLVTTAESHNSEGAVRYKSDDTQIAEIDQSGNLTILQAGTTTIRAYLAPKGEFIGAEISYTLTVNKDANDTLSFMGIKAGDTVTRDYGDDRFAYMAVAEADSDGDISYSSGDPDIAEVDSETGQVTIKNAGQTTIKATQEEGTNYLKGDISYNLSISKVPSNLTWNGKAADGSVDRTYDSGNFTFQVDSNSKDSDIVYTLKGEQPGANVADVAVIDHATGEVAIKGVGSVEVQATQLESDNYEKTSVAYSLKVHPGDPTLTWEDSKGLIQSGRVNQNEGSADFTIPAVSQAGSSGSVAYDVVGDQKIATVDQNGTVSLNGNRGAVKIEAEISKHGNYRSQVIGYTLIVGRGATKPNFGWDNSVKNGEYVVTYNDIGHVTKATSSNSTGAVRYKSDDTQIAEIDQSGNLTILQAGTTTIRAYLAPKDEFTGAEVSYTLTVEKDDNNTLSFMEINAGDTVARDYGDDRFAYSVVAEPDSDGDIGYISGNPNIAKVDQNTGWITIKQAGNTTIIAKQKEGTNYLKGGVAYKLTINKIFSKLTWSGEAASGTVYRTYGDKDFLFQVGSSSDEESVTYSLIDEKPSANVVSVASIDEDTGKIAIEGAGSVTVSATQKESVNYKETTSKYQLIVSQGSRSDLTWQDASAAKGTVIKHFGDQSFTIEAASTDSEGDIQYQVIGNSDIATVEPSTGKVNLGTRTGVVNVIATQEAYGSYAETQVAYVLKVGRQQDSDLSWGKIKDGASVNATFGMATPPLNTASATSTGTITYTSDNPAVAGVHENTGVLTLNQSGKATITAHLEATDTVAADSVTYILKVAKSAVNTLTWSDGVSDDGSVDVSYQDDRYPHITATSIDPKAVISYSSSDSNVADVNRFTGELTVHGSGPTTITAQHDATSRFEASEIQYMLNVAKASSDLHWDQTEVSDGSHTMNYASTETFTASATSSQGDITYSVTQGGDVVSVDQRSGQLTTKKTGQATVTATQAEDGDHAATSISYTIDVQPSTPVLEWDQADAESGQVNVTFDDASYTATVSASYQGQEVTGEVQYTSIDTKIVDVDSSGLVSFTAIGTTDIKASFTPDDPGFLPANESYQITLKKGVGKPLDVGKNMLLTIGESGSQPVQGGNGGVLTYSSGDTSIATVDSTGEVTSIKLGRTKITVTESETAKYLEQSARYMVTVKPKPPFIVLNYCFSGYNSQRPQQTDYAILNSEGWSLDEVRVESESQNGGGSVYDTSPKAGSSTIWWSYDAHDRDVKHRATLKYSEGSSHYQITTDWMICDY
ncbi:inverse autotransporter beta domain-containing protein [Endozoicomonas sp. 4G]|uniref:inverse autotransporter beta domain-containing protein n=1 Tax=Endozoicomonas sp. 4G TaxID=2872754 RepID=UPI0020790ADC|nr:inverse autotransporter beta domain-containing protein [Endozoicomonas sp. 4G]